MKQLKDYLHLYLGCDAILQGMFSIRKIKIVGYNIDSETVHYTYEKNGNLVHSFCPIEQVKLHLRPLSSMTEEEAIEYREPQKVTTDTVHVVMIYVDTPESLYYLLSKHFDIFGLCEAGLAIDATTLKPHKKVQHYECWTKK